MRRRWVACLVAVLAALALAPVRAMAAAPVTLWVNGTDILQEDDLKVTCGAGTAEYDRGTNTLTLTDVTIEGDFSGSAAINVNGDVNIRLVGTNTISSGWYGVYAAHSNGTVAFCGSGTLTISSSNGCVRAEDIIVGTVGEEGGPTINATSQNGSGLYATNTLTVQNGSTVTAESKDSDYSYALFADSEVNIVDSTLSATTAGEGAALGAVSSVNITRSKVLASAKGSSIAAYEGGVHMTDSVVIADSPTTHYSVYGSAGGSISGTWLDSTNPYVWEAITNNAQNSVVILETAGTVTGDHALPSDAELRAGVTLSVPESTSLTVPKGVTLHNNGTVELHGQYTNNGTTVCAAGSHAGGTATCASPATCALCGYAYGDKDPANHASLAHVDAVAATHLTEGTIEHWHCDGCGKYYGDAAATNAISAADTVAPRLEGHAPDGSGWHSDASGHWQLCACGEKVSAGGHELEWVTDREPAVGVAGSRHQECATCGYKTAAEEVPALEPVEHEVTLVLGNGSADVVVSVEDGALLARPDDPVREGHDFAGWFMTADADGRLSDPYDFSAPVTGDLTLYAGWVPAASEDGEPESGAEKPEKSEALANTGDPTVLLAPLAACAAGAAALAASIRARRR